jgi:uncharacterized damage-inducible protein DinB
MPMDVPPVTDEQQGLLDFLAQQRQALRYSAYGLTDDQARRTTTASTLSVGGLIKHVAGAENGWMDRIEQINEEGLSDYDTYLAEFHLQPGESVADALAVYDTAAARTQRVITSISDLGRPVPVPQGVPWFPDDVEAWSVRWVLLHLIEETARHAGHADIIRESLDGATAGPLMAAAENWDPEGWITPWTPEGARA